MLFPNFNFGVSIENIILYGPEFTSVPCFSLSDSESEFNEFEPILKSAKTGFN